MEPSGPSVNESRHKGRLSRFTLRNRRARYWRRQTLLDRKRVSGFGEVEVVVCLTGLRPVRAGHFVGVLDAGAGDIAVAVLIAPRAHISCSTGVISGARSSRGYNLLNGMAELSIEFATVIRSSLGKERGYHSGAR